MTEQCELCGKKYETIYRVPNEVWTHIAPNKSTLGPYIEHQYGGLLCIDCAFLEAKKAGMPIMFVGEHHPPIQPDTVEPITERQLDAIWEHGFDAESSDEQEYCGSLIRARNSLDEIAKPDTVAVPRELLKALVKSYVANPGTDSEFIRFVGGSKKDSGVWPLWTELRALLDQGLTDGTDTDVGTKSTQPDTAEPDRLRDHYLAKWKECDAELKNLCSEYHNTIAEMESEIEELKAKPDTVAVEREVLEDWEAAMLSSDEGERRSMRDAIRALLDQEK